MAQIKKKENSPFFHPLVLLRPSIDEATHIDESGFSLLSPVIQMLISSGNIFMDTLKYPCALSSWHVELSLSVHGSYIGNQVSHLRQFQLYYLVLNFTLSLCLLLGLFCFFRWTLQGQGPNTLLHLHILEFLIWWSTLKESLSKTRK